MLQQYLWPPKTWGKLSLCIALTIHSVACEQKARPQQSQKHLWKKKRHFITKQRLFCNSHSVEHVGGVYASSRQDYKVNGRHSTLHVSYLAGNAAEATHAVHVNEISHYTILQCSCHWSADPSHRIITLYILELEFVDTRLRRITYYLCIFVLPVCDILCFGC